MVRNAKCIYCGAVLRSNRNKCEYCGQISGADVIGDLQSISSNLKQSIKQSSKKASTASKSLLNKGSEAIKGSLTPFEINNTKNVFNPQRIERPNAIKVNRKLQKKYLLLLCSTFILLALLPYGISILESPNKIASLEYIDFIEAVQDNKISRVLLQPDKSSAEIIEKDGTRSVVNLQPDKNLLNILTEHNVDIAVQPVKQPSISKELTISFTFIIIFIGGLIFLFRRPKGY